MSITRNVPARPAVPVPAIRLAPAIIPRPVSVKTPVDLPVQLPFYAPVNVPAVPATPVVLDAPVVQQINPISVPVSPAVPNAFPIGVVQNAPIPLPYNTVSHENVVDAYRLADPFAFGPLPLALDHHVMFAKGF